MNIKKIREIFRDNQNLIVLGLSVLLPGLILVIIISGKISQRLSLVPKATDNGQPSSQCELTILVSPPTATPTPVPVSGGTNCKRFLLNGSDQNTTTVVVNQQVSLGVSVDNFALIRYGEVANVGDRVIDSANPRTWSQGNRTFSTTFTPIKSGIYAFEINSYESNRCQYLCSAGSILYKNTNASGGGCDTRGHWEQFGSCSSNNCRKWLVVN